MTVLTIGIPVYNGEDCLEDCLHSVLSQSFDDIAVLIFDNKSTDRTAEIARDFVRIDPRLQYFCNDQNIGAGRNFSRALAAAQTEFFAWRADDDLASHDYFERLIATLKHDPSAALAVGHIETHISHKNRIKHRRTVANGNAPRIVGVVRQMFNSHAAWIYGTWRTNRLHQYYSSVNRQYTAIWAQDHLILLNAILDQAVTCDERAIFIQRLGVRNRDSFVELRNLDRIASREELLPSFRKCCQVAVDQRKWNTLERIALNAVIGRYSRKRVILSRFKVCSLRLRSMLFGG